VRVFGEITRDLKAMLKISKTCLIKFAKSIENVLIPFWFTFS